MSDPLSEQDDEVQKGYRAAAIRILRDIEEEDAHVPTQVEALLFLAEALVDLAETMEPVNAR